MIPGERLSAVAKRRRLNGTHASGTSSPTSSINTPSIPPQSIEQEALEEESGFATLAIQNLVQFSSTKEVDVVNERAIRIRLSRDQQCLVSGVYILWLKRGHVALNGARLYASHERLERYTIFAPEGYDIPPITCLSELSEFELDVFEDEIPVGFGLRPYTWANAPHEIRITRSFIVHGVSPEDPLMAKSARFIDSRAADMACNTLRASGSSAVTLGSPKLVLLGARFPGVSSHFLAIINRLVTEIDDRGQHRYPRGVLVLDLDPHQPDFGPPGTISLVNVSRPLFGPAYTRCDVLPRGVVLNKVTAKADSRLGHAAYQILEMRFVGTNGNLIGEEHTFENLLRMAMNCSKSYPECPMVVKAWDLCEFLQPDFIKPIQDIVAPTHVFGVRSVYSGTIESSGKQLASNAGIPFYDLQVPTAQEPSSFEQHLMSMRSYFHLRDAELRDSPPRTRWDPLPVRLLSDHRQIWIPYDQKDSTSALRSIWCKGGEDLSGRNLLDVLLESVVAFLYTLDADPGWDTKASPYHISNSQYQDGKLKYSVNDQSGTTPNINSIMHDNNTRQPTIVCDETTLHLPMVRRTDERMKSHYCWGLGIIKSIDMFERKLCIWSPLSADNNHSRLLNTGRKLHLIVQPIDAHGRFSTSWLRLE